MGRNTRDDATASTPAGVLAMVLACSFLASFAQTMVNIALPQMAERFSVTLSTANWLIAGYTVVAATSITLAAYLLDRFGLRRVFFAGCGAIALGSGLALLAPNFPALVACRLVQAVGTGLFYPTVTSVITTVSAPRLLGVRLALNSGVIAVGLAVSPVISGLLLTYFGWRLMFAVPCARAAALLAVGFFRMRDLRPRERGKADLPSVALSLVGLGALVYGLGEIAHDVLPAAVALGAGVLVLAAFVVRQLRLARPLLNLRPLEHPRFAFGLVLNMLGTMVSFSLSVLLPLYYEGAEGRTAFLAGALLLGPVLANAGFAYLGGRLYDKGGLWPLVPGGFALALGGLAAVATAAGGRITWAVVLASAVAYAGIGFVTSPSKTAALAQLPPELLPHGSATNSTFVQIANAVSSALFVGVLSADVLRETSSGMAKAQAYADGFAHTLLIAIGVAAVGTLVAVIYSRALRKGKAAPARDRSPRRP